MFKFLIVMFFFFLLLVFLLGFSVLRTFKNMLFGSSDSKSNAKRRHSNVRSESRQSNTANNRGGTTHRKKIIAKDEGEYVDFEEVK